MNDDHGIAWMIAGGLRGETREDVRMRMHRLRGRINAAVDGRTWSRRDPVAITFNADGCPA